MTIKNVCVSRAVQDRVCNRIFDEQRMQGKMGENMILTRWIRGYSWSPKAWSCALHYNPFWQHLILPQVKGGLQGGKGAEMRRPHQQPLLLFPWDTYSGQAVNTWCVHHFHLYSVQRPFSGGGRLSKPFSLLEVPVMCWKPHNIFCFRCHYGSHLKGFCGSVGSHLNG